MIKIRLNKYISDSGYCSRREADKYIEQGRVTINNKEVEIGSQVREGDVVAVDGERINSVKKRLYIAFNKPVGVTCTTDTKDATNIIKFINHPQRIFHIGRLDKLSEGLIFLTNDGDIVNKILRAGNDHEKEYVVTVDKPVTDDFLHKMSSGVRILGVVTKPCRVMRETDTRFRVILTQGINRQIRRMCEALGYNVLKLKRMRIMNITLGALEVGRWRYFTPQEIDALTAMLDSSVGTEDASPSPKRQHKAHSSYRDYKSHSGGKRAVRPSERYAEPTDMDDAEPQGKPQGKFSGKPSGKPFGKPSGRPSGKFAPKSAGKSETRTVAKSKPKFNKKIK